MKLSLEALKERAEATASNELLATITGGNENACHDGATTATVTPPPPPPPSVQWQINWGVSVPVGGQPTFNLGGTIKF
ncbi:hypothetical protein [Flavobacterium sp.]|jgi:hypothetical protein|uniref:hypothetical protein n=1 Tax=Flavobacterium sp. TaxID=239 RepID=UPI0037BEFB8D